MDRCDVLIVGGGPAGSSCARALHRAGLEVVVMDRAQFPRDKTCAGWITPAVLELLELDSRDYRSRNVFQSISGFRTGFMHGPMLDTHYGRTVSYAIRRCEFDDYLLRRSGARLRLGEPLRRLERSARGWLANNALQAGAVVGAGGHFCPVARLLGADTGRSELAVIAQECEVTLAAARWSETMCAPGIPELYFCRDLRGYGWCLRKGDVVNIGLGREGDHRLAEQVAAFHSLLVAAGRIPAGLQPRFRGHAYLLYGHARRKLLDDDVLLAGDAAGLAASQSGEGIRPAIESGLLAAATLLQADGDYSRTRLESYAGRLRSRYGARTRSDWSAWLPQAGRELVAQGLLNSRWFVRHGLLDRGFLQINAAPLRL